MLLTFVVCTYIQVYGYCPPVMARNKYVPGRHIQAGKVFLPTVVHTGYKGFSVSGSRQVKSYAKFGRLI